MNIELSFRSNLGYFPTYLEEVTSINLTKVEPREYYYHGNKKKCYQLKLFYKKDNKSFLDKYEAEEIKLKTSLIDVEIELINPYWQERNKEIKF